MKLLRFPLNRVRWMKVKMKMKMKVQLGLPCFWMLWEIYLKRQPIKNLSDIHSIDFVLA